MNTAGIAIMMWVLVVMASLPIVFVGVKSWKRRAPKPNFDTFIEPSIDLDVLGRCL